MAGRRREDRLNSELTVLLASARSDFSAQNAARVCEAAPGVNWDSLWTLARGHGVGWLVAGNLRTLLDSAGRQLLPESVKESWQRDLWQDTARALLLAHCQTSLAAAFEQAGVSSLWLKGLLLSIQLYGRPEARCCSDLDVLVQLGDIARASSCLREQGFWLHHEAQPGLSAHPLRTHHQEWCKEAADGTIVVVELHHRLSGLAGCQPPAELLSARARSLDLQGRPLRVLSAEDELVLLCCHAHQHNFGFLRCLTDVAEYVKKNHSLLDGARLRAAARLGYGCGRVAAALWLANAVFGLGAGAAIDFPTPTGRQLWALRGLSAERLGRLGGEEDRPRTLRLTLLMDRWRDVFALLRICLFPPSEYLRAVYPEPWAAWPGLARVCYALRGMSRILRPGH
jgi:hypothetical protein